MLTDIAVIGPQTLSELRSFASDAAKTGFYGARTAEQALLIAATGRDLGLSYTAALRLFHVIDGKPSLSADGMVAIVLASGQCDYFETCESTSEVATVKTRRKGRSERTMSFTLAEAQKAGLSNRGNWGKYPAAMLRARAKSALARDVYPDLLAGIYDPDELAAADVEERPREQVLTQVIEGKSAPQAAQMYADLCAALSHASTPEAFAELAKSATGLTRKDLDAFRSRFKARKAELARQAAPVVVEPSAPVSEPEPPLFRDEPFDADPAAPAHDAYDVAAFTDAIASADSVQALDAIGGQIAAARAHGFEPPAPLRAAYRARMTELAARDLA